MWNQNLILQIAHLRACVRLKELGWSQAVFRQDSVYAQLCGRKSGASRPALLGYARLTLAALG